MDSASRTVIHAAETAGHDIDYARLRLLSLLQERGATTSVSCDFTDIEEWLPRSDLLVSYVATLDLLVAPLKKDPERSTALV